MFAPIDSDAMIKVCVTEKQTPKTNKRRGILKKGIRKSNNLGREHHSIPSGLVLEVDGGLVPSAKIIVNRDALSEQQEDAPPQHHSSRESEHNGNEDEPELDNYLSCHELAHKRAEEWHNKRKWPWERNNELGNKEEEEDEDAQAFTNQELYNKFNRPRGKRSGDDGLTLQKFIYEDGYIVCSGNHNLVLGVAEGEGRVSEVILVKRLPDDIHQRWIMHANGLIQAKHNPSMVLTVSMPEMTRTDENGLVMSYIGCSLTLQSKRTAQFGRANQRFVLNQDTKQILAFHTDLMDKEVTAANKANVCTFAVMGVTEIDQPGYYADIELGKGTKPKRVLVCSSCARAMRGRFKLEKVTDSIDFSCAMGTAKEQGLKQIGSFQCLNGKVDLSTFEAEHTLEEWETQLDSLREKLSVRAIAKEISAARVPYTVKILAYRNGQGRLKPGEVIVGSSVNGLLEQATHRLEMGQAARRLYTADGTIVLDIDDLVTWMQEQYVKDARAKIREEKRAKMAAAATSEKALMDNVELESSDEPEDEEDPENEDEEDEEAEDQPVLTYDHDKCSTLGDELVPNRQYIAGERESKATIIPSLAKSFPFEKGFLLSLNFLASATGPITFAMMRPEHGKDKTFKVVWKFEYNVSQTGEMGIDFLSDPILCQRGDVLGLQDPSGKIIQFDLVPQQKEDTLKMETGDIKEDDVIAFKPHTIGARTYSLYTVVAPAIEKRPTPPPSRPTRPKTAKKGGATKKTRKGPHIDPPPVEMVLKYPIEVWVAMTEPFHKPEKVEKKFENNLQQREERAAVAYELEKEKHILRQMQGRRIEGAKPGEYKSTLNPTAPVLIEGHWQEPTVDEQVKHDTVHQLQTHMSELKANQKKKARSSSANYGSRLYTQPKMKRVLVFPNGDSISRAVNVWGESLAQLLENATSRLDLSKAGNYLFSMEGEMIRNFDDIEGDQLLCVSYKQKFTPPKESQQAIEVKANWGRARREYGPTATDIMVTAQKNSVVDVDPFGPSPLAGGPKSQRNSFATTPKSRAREREY